jgi:hypothetical protein
LGGWGRGGGRGRCLGVGVMRIASIDSAQRCVGRGGLGGGGGVGEGSVFGGGGDEDRVDRLGAEVGGAFGGDGVAAWEWAGRGWAGPGWTGAGFKLLPARSLLTSAPPPHRHPNPHSPGFAPRCTSQRTTSRPTPSEPRERWGPDAIRRPRRGPAAAGAAARLRPQSSLVSRPLAPSHLPFPPAPGTWTTRWSSRTRARGARRAPRVSGLWTITGCGRGQGPCPQLAAPGKAAPAPAARLPRRPNSA